MAERRAPKVFTIPPYRAFADALVAGIIAQFGKDRMELAGGLILVPNNRAGQAIRDAFVRQAEGGLLLPRLVAIGDEDLGEAVGVALDPMDAEPIPPAVNPLERQLILARLIQQHRAVAADLPNADAAEAMRLAADLARTLDQLTVEEKTAADLQAIEPGDLQSHWQKSFALLSVILEEWPRELAAIGKIDLADRRNRLLRRVADYWHSTPPLGYVIAAGISTGAPAIARVLKTVANLPNGQVVLAGLDLEMPPKDWDSVGGDDEQAPIETHPQYHLWQLLRGMGVARGEVDLWRWGGGADARSARGKSISHAFAPAEATREWNLLPPGERSLSGVTALELATPAEEAQTIALALRSALEVPGQTAALVTPDRDLATRVSQHLARWGIRADDSAGERLSANPHGTLILAMANAAVGHFDPVNLLALLKHPLVRAQDGRLEWLDGARALDLALRGPRPEPGLAGVTHYLQCGDARQRKIREAVQHFWAEAAALLAPLETLRTLSQAAGVAPALAVLREVAEALAGEAIWAGEAGRALSELVAGLEAGSAIGPHHVPFDCLPLLLHQAMDSVAIRPGYGGHNRLFIWGLLEAKLQSAQFMVLGGLNEGVWPQIPAPDPWLAPKIRKDLKLPGLERRIGLSAHDLAGALGAPKVLLTRAKRDASGPTNPSRFWLRIETLANGFAAPEPRFDLLARALDDAKGERAKPPAPKPPVDHRPTTINVTDVDGLKADPFAFYARKMLGLSALDAPGAEPDAKWRGVFLHDIFGKWGQEDKFAKGRLVPRLQAAFDASGLHPVVRAMWQPRFEEAAQNFEDRIEAAREEGREPLVAEVQGSNEFLGIKLVGRVDRIDRLPDGKLAIIDYKTGAPPEKKQVVLGYAMQLGLLAHLAECGAFEGVSGSAELFEYWSQARESGKPYGYVKSPNMNRNKPIQPPADFVENIYQQFEDAVEKWLIGDVPFTAKEKPEYAYDEFDQLMRYEEWQGRSG